MNMQAVGITVFTHIDVKGVQRDFNITKLDAMLQRGYDAGLYDVIFADVDPVFAEFCLHHRGVEQHRLDRITIHSFQHALIFAYDVGGDKTHLLIDGHHRYVKAWQMGMKVIPAIVAEPEIWQQCLLKNMKPRTAEELASMSSNIA